MEKTIKTEFEIFVEKAIVALESQIQAMENRIYETKEFPGGSEFFVNLREKKKELVNIKAALAAYKKGVKK